jgi:hypothetical protein
MTLNPFLYFSIGVVEKGEVVHRMGESPLTGAVPVSPFLHDRNHSEIWENGFDSPRK